MPVAQDTQSANASSGQQQQGGGSDALADPLSDPLAEGPKFKLPERIGNEHIYIAEKEKLPTALNQLEDGQSSASVASLVAPSFGEGEIATTFTRVGDDLQFTGTGTMNQTKDVSLGDVTLKSGGAYQVDVVGSLCDRTVQAPHAR